ncbi:circadian clock KaiB family protein [Piscinibacter koreensis]|uniref:Circadian clock protein KaiB n=1 Tax=Piscinibacter koreensis TaxID=2742824 RepID=A0A7Y6NMG6_9BURK|nr:circadian clock KaiB family protein [Schlegelella koreensis]NUZ05862.1 circadian clock protein KaiB [Schlegelella koreensis]
MEPAAPPDFAFRLYVSGATPASARALVNTRRICETHLAGRYRLDILELAEHVELATRDQIVAAPTLIKLSPPPLRRFIGDLSENEGLLRCLPAATAG